MNTTIHIWFNARGVTLPDNNEWEKFGEVDALRTFLICTDSWRTAGWQVKRLSTAPVSVTPYLGDEVLVNHGFPPTIFNGRCCSQMKWYLPEMWQFIAKAKSVAVPGINWFTSMDVINRGWHPVSAEADWMRENVRGCASGQIEHFSMAMIGCTYQWLVDAEQVLINYDRGQLPEIRGNYVSDERILREYFPGGNMRNQKFACNEGDEPLIHFARSTLARSYREIQLS